MERRQFLRRTTAGAAGLGAGALTAAAVPHAEAAPVAARRTGPLRVDIVMFDGVEELDCIEGRPCTTHHGAKAYLGEHGGIVKNARVVDDGNLVTAAGITSGLELGLWLVGRELGSDAATGVEAMLEYEARGTVWQAN
ncbi:DJ-1/PfpI family protein [Streptomyces parvulus]|uniref:DJ-1/PfpI family protein n=1 Tax=Streptomyces parvulus TaxID=146923 RepID=A0ABV5DEY1_9ACTN